jgi:hypothetical protein
MPEAFMADWAALMDRLNQQVLASFGREVTYSPQGDTPFPLTGILEAAARPEDSAPGTYAVLFVRASAFDQPPERGDEVTVSNSVYKVVDLEADAAGGILLRLRQA